MKSFVAIGLLSLVSVFQTVNAESSLYIADQEAAAIYVRNSDDPSARPIFLSGRLNISASASVFLDKNRMVFQPLEQWHLIAMVDTTTGELEKIHELTEDDELLGMSLGPEGEVVCPLLRGSNLLIAELRADGDTWAYSELAMPDSMIGTFISLQVFKTAPNDYFLAAKSRDLRLYHLGTDPEATLTELQLETGAEHVYMNNSDRRILVVSRTGVGLNFFNFEGTAMDAFAVSNSWIWRRQFEFIDWGAAPELVSIPNAIIEIDDPPFNRSPREVYSAYEDRKTDTKRDPSGVQSFIRPKGNDWTIYDGTKLGIYDVGLESDTLTNRFLFERGKGPALNTIQEIVFGPDEMLYVFSENNNTWKILKVDPVTGDRSVYMSLPDDRYLEGMNTDENGNLRIIKPIEREFPYRYETFHTYSMITIPTGVTNPTLQIAEHHGIGVVSPMDIHFLWNGDAVAIRSDDGLKKLTYHGYGVRHDINMLSLPFSDFELVAEEGDVYTLEATVTMPESRRGTKVSGVENEHQVLPGYNAFDGVKTYPLPMELITPSGLAIEAACNLVQTDFQVVPSSYLGRVIFKFPEEDAAGTWRLWIRHTDPHLGIYEYTHLATSRGWMLPQSVQVEQIGERELLIRELFPFGMTAFQIDSQIARDVTPTISEELADELQYPGDFLTVPGGEYFLSSYNSTDIVKVSASGVATVYASGRPAEVDPVLLGLSERSLLHLAYGPRVVQDLRPSGWLLE